MDHPNRPITKEEIVAHLEVINLHGHKIVTTRDHIATIFATIFRAIFGEVLPKKCKIG